MPLVLGVVGGALLIIGPLLTWASASLDIPKFAAALGAPVDVVESALGSAAHPYTVSGLHTGAHGTLALVAGIAAIIFAVILVVLRGQVAKVMGGLLVLAGLLGAGAAVYDLSKIGDLRSEAQAGVASVLESAGVDPSVVTGVLKVSAGIGIYVCALGGILAVVAGILALVSKPSEPAAADAMGGSPGYVRTSPVGSGFEATSPPPAPATPLQELSGAAEAPEPPPTLPPDAPSGEDDATSG